MSNVKRCSRNDRHDQHWFEHAEDRWMCPGYLGDSDALEKTSAQRRMEAWDEAHANVRTLTNEAVRLMLTPGWTDDKRTELAVRFRVELVKANAVAALAYAISETGSDLELAMSKLGTVLEQGIDLNH